MTGIWMIVSQRSDLPQFLLSLCGEHEETMESTKDGTKDREDLNYAKDKTLRAGLWVGIECRRMYGRQLLWDRNENDWDKKDLDEE